MHGHGDFLGRLDEAEARDEAQLAELAKAAADEEMIHDVARRLAAEQGLDSASEAALRQQLRARLHAQCAQAQHEAQAQAQAQAQAARHANAAAGGYRRGAAEHLGAQSPSPPHRAHGLCQRADMSSPLSAGAWGAGDPLASDAYGGRPVRRQAAAGRFDGAAGGHAANTAQQLLPERGGFGGAPGRRNPNASSVVGGIFA